MGQFSWICADTGMPAYSDDPKKTYYLLVPNEFQEEFGEYFEEQDYEGYGVFGGKDAYALAAQCNFPDRCKNQDGSWKNDEEIRGFGIDIAIGDNNASLKYPIKITSSPKKYNEVGYSPDDPNQGWHTDD